MNPKTMLKLSKKRTAIFGKILANIELVEKGKLKFNNKAGQKLLKELDTIEKMYRKALKNETK